MYRRIQFDQVESSLSELCKKPFIVLNGGICDFEMNISLGEYFTYPSGNQANLSLPYSSLPIKMSN